MTTNRSRQARVSGLSLLCIRKRTCFSMAVAAAGLMVGLASAGEPLRIMPLGDSITVGTTDAAWSVPFTFGYRGPLYTRLKNAGYDFVFVGASPEPWNGNPYGPPPKFLGPDLRSLNQNGHRGYGGSVIGDILNGNGYDPGVVAALNADRPDIVLLMVGINDIARFGDTGDPVDVKHKLQDLVQTIVDTPPAACIIVAQIPPYQTGQNTEPVQRYNEFIQTTLVPFFANQGRNVRAADQHANFINPDGKVDARLYASIAHPNRAGYARMAKTWFEAIRAMIPPPKSVMDRDGEAATNKARLPCDLNTKIDPRGAPWTRGLWQKHGVVCLDGSATGRVLPAKLAMLGGIWGYNNSQMPYLVYMPERKRLLLAASVDKPKTKAVQVFSDDFGETWTRPAWMHVNAAGAADLSSATQLTYLGDGKLILGDENRYWFSADYGETWNEHAPVPRGADGKMMYPWDPMLVDRLSDAGSAVRLIETRYKENGTFNTAEYFSQGCVRFSMDEGKTWSREIDVPQWKRVNEVVLCRAKNGDLVAACRTDNPEQFLVGYDDQYSGLATSVSKDGGKTWSELNRLYAWGRHHPHMVVMPNGDIIMTYVVRNGYVADRNGLSRFGVEAVVSTDNGTTWDLDRKYILASNSSVMSGDRHSWGSPQSTSSVVLPDGSLLTAFGTGVRNVPSQTLWLMDVALLKWRPNERLANADKTLCNAPDDSDLRNRFDLDSVNMKNAVD